jgi:hypothetical protein
LGGFFFFTSLMNYLFVVLGNESSASHSRQAPLSYTLIPKYRLY